MYDWIQRNMDSPRSSPNIFTRDMKNFSYGILLALMVHMVVLKYELEYFNSMVPSPWIWVSLYLFWPIDFVVNKSHSSLFWHLWWLASLWRKVPVMNFNYLKTAMLERTHVGEWFRLSQIFWAIHGSDAILGRLDLYRFSLLNNRASKKS